MRLIFKVLNVTCLVSVCVSSALAGTLTVKHKNEIPNFTAGFYTLERYSPRESMDSCLDGEFKVVESGKQLILGPKHGFSLLNRVQKTVATDDPAEIGCVYENTNTYTVSETVTVVSSKEILRCDGSVRHSFVETATLTKDKVHLEFKQTSGAVATPADNAAEYICDWVVGKRATASVKKSKKK